MENKKLAEFIANEVTKAIQNYDFNEIVSKAIDNHHAKHHFDSIVQDVFENHDPETSGRWFYELIGEIIQKNTALGNLEHKE
jgi:hypothetical protein